MAIDSALIKLVSDALMQLLNIGNDVRLARKAEANIREAIRNLLLANPDENKADAAILAAKAAKLLSPDVILAEQMLKKVRKTKKKAAKKKVTKKRPAKKKVAKRKG